MMNSSDSTPGVDFLTSVLVRFPELGSASLGPSRGEIRLEFYLQQELDGEKFQEFVEKFKMSWELFFELLKVETLTRRISRVIDYPSEVHDDDADVEILRVTRDLETLTLEELSMMVNLVRERFIATLIEGEAVEATEARYQEQVLLKSLDKVRNNPMAFHGLTGFRDDMRVLVYSSEEQESELSPNRGRN